MNILSITAGAADMFCGSCLRDNALAAELVRARARGDAAAVYTPTVTDEANVSRRNACSSAGISVYLQQHARVLSPHAVAARPALGRAGVIKRVRRALDPDVDPRMLGALTVSTLQGRERLPAQGDRQTRGLARRTSRVPDVVNLPNSLLIALAAPIRRVLKRPIVVTLQGEDLFLEGCPSRTGRNRWR